MVRQESFVGGVTLRRSRLVPNAVRALTLLALAVAMLSLGAVPLLARHEPCLPSQPGSPRPGAGDEPHIVLTPGFLGQTLCRDTTASQPLTLCNEGGSQLAWTIGESGGPLSDVPWLSEIPTGGALDPGDCQVVTVTFDASGLLPGPYMVHLIVASNDPDTPEVLVPTFLSVPEAVGGADFSWVPTLPVVGEEVAFEAWASGDEPVEYVWDLGDGSVESGALAAHSYATAGDYLVVLTASNACGLASAQHTLTVAPAHIWLPLVTR